MWPLFFVLLCTPSLAADVNQEELADAVGAIQSERARAARLRLEAESHQGSWRERLLHAADLVETPLSSTEVELVLLLALSDSASDRAQADEFIAGKTSERDVEPASRSSEAPAPKPAPARTGRVIMAPTMKAAEPKASAPPPTVVKPQPTKNRSVVMPSSIKPTPKSPVDTPELPEVEEGPDESALLAYKKRRLYREYRTLTALSGGVVPVAQGNIFYSNAVSAQVWTPFDGSGRMLSVPEFFTKAGQMGEVVRWRRTQDALKTQGTAGVAAGVVGMAASLVLVGVGAHEIDNGRRGGPVLISGLALLGAGGGSAAWGSLRFHKRKMLAGFVTENVSATRADRMIDEHNQKLRERLGLREEDVMDLDD